DGPVEAAWALALEHQLGAAQPEVGIAAVAGVGVEVTDIAVVPVAVTLHHALEGDRGTSDGPQVDGHGGRCGEHADGGDEGNGKDGGFHAIAPAGRGVDAAILGDRGFSQV